MSNNPFQNLPQGWEVKTLGEIFLIERGGSPRPIKEYLTTNSDGINWIKIGDTKNVTKYISETAQKIKPEGKKYSRFVEIGDLILSNSMSFGKPYIMKTTGCIHDGWVVFKQSKKIIDEEFCYYVLSSSEIYAQFDKLATGSTVKNLNIERIQQIQIPLPPLETQQKIVAKLESEFAKIEAAKSHLEKVKETIPRLKNSLLKSAFSGKLTESAVIVGKAQQSTMSQTLDLTVESNIIDCHEAKASRNDESLLQGWEVKTLGEITNYGKTTQKQPKDLKPNDWILELEDIKKESGILLNKIAFKDRQSKSNKIIFHKGNVLFGTLRPYLKKVIIADDDGYCSSEIMPFDSGNEITNHYLAYLFLSDFMGNKIAMLTYGTRMPRLGTKNGKELPIPLPPLQTQKQIVEILDSKFATLENLEKETNASLEKLHKLKSSLLNQAFKGELIC